MIYNIIYLIFLFIFVGVIFISDKTAEKPNGNILLGVTLPYSKLEDGRVKEIVKAYHKAYMLNIIIYLILFLPFFLLYRFVSLQLLYLLIWIVTMLFINQKIINIYWYKLYDLKCQEEWFIGIKNTITIDTEVVRLKDKMVLSKLWFIPAIIISLVPIAINTTDWIFSLIPFASILIFIFAYFVNVNQKTKVYSENTQINLALNKVYKWQWSKCWIISSYISLVFPISYWIFIINDTMNPQLIIFPIILSSFFSLFVIINSYNNIRNERQRIFKIENSDVFVDNDQYWVGGIYNNPNDSSTSVEKRIGYGTTVNMASRAAKAINIILIFAVIGFLSMIVFFAKIELGELNVQITNTDVKLSAPYFEQSFSIEEIQDLKLVNPLPKFRKNNGFDGATLYFGKFSASGYDNSYIYIHRENPMCIIVILEDETIIFNSVNTKFTEIYYNQLKSIYLEEETNK